mgnify:CR=1 FL=1
MRVKLAYNNLDGGDGEEAEFEAKLRRKQCSFANDLIKALHGKAFRQMQELLNDSPAELRSPDGYQLVHAALSGFEKLGITRKTEAFTKFFKSSGRKRGEDINDYLKNKVDSWQDLSDLDEETSLSDDLMAFFTLEGLGVSDDAKRQILMNCGSQYDSVKLEQCLRVNYHDLHLKEKRTGSDLQPEGKGRRGKGGFKKFTKPRGTAKAYAAEDHFDEHAEGDDAEADETADLAEEFECVSDAGASGDDEVFTANSVVKEARKKLQTMQKQRGFFQASGEISFDERKASDPQGKGEVSLRRLRAHRTLGRR